MTEKANDHLVEVTMRLGELSMEGYTADDFGVSDEDLKILLDPDHALMLAIFIEDDPVIRERLMEYLPCDDIELDKTNEDLEKYSNSWGEVLSEDDKYPLNGNGRIPYPPDDVWFDKMGNPDAPLTLTAAQEAWLRWRDAEEAAMPKPPAIVERMSNIEIRKKT